MSFKFEIEPSETLASTKWPRERAYVLCYASDYVLFERLLNELHDPTRSRFYWYIYSLDTEYINRIKYGYSTIRDEATLLEAKREVHALSLRCLIQP